MEDLTYGFSSLPNPVLNNRSFRVFTGNTLGGTSSINGMQFSIPIRRTVEKWGIEGLTTASSKKFFQRVIDQIGVAVPEGNLRHKYVRNYINAARKAGFSESVDLLDDSNSRSISENRLTVDPNGFRRDSCTAYLSPTIKDKCKTNLRLVQDATVTRILLSKSRPQRAFGVDYVHSNDTQMSYPKRILARKEVIVCAGPFGSPKLLQVSGIGPAHVLRKAGVKVRVALPVGRRCQAKTVTPVDMKYTGAPLEPSMNSTLVNSEEELRKFKSGRGGLLGITPSFATGKDNRNGFISANGHTFPTVFDRNALGAACSNNVRSFGYYQIRDKNPFSTPDVQLALLTNQDDLRRVIKCLKGVKDTFQNFAPLFKSSIENPVGGEITEEWVRRTAVWNGHFVGGCPVGDVLRGDLTVRKMRQLRVVDASSLRRMPLSAGPMGSVYMIAEYMAEVIART